MRLFHLKVLVPKMGWFKVRAMGTDMYRSSFVPSSCFMKSNEVFSESLPPVIQMFWSMESAPAICMKLFRTNVYDPSPCW